MILSDKDLTERLSSEQNLVNILPNPNVEVLPSRKVQAGHVRVPEEVRKLLGSVAGVGDSNAVDLSAAFGVTDVAIRSYSRGLNGQVFDSELADVVETAKENKDKPTLESAHSQALDALMSSLKILTPRLETEVGLKLTTVSKIARDMSGIVKNLTPEKKGDVTINKTQVILYNPGQAIEADYDVVEG